MLGRVGVLALTLGVLTSAWAAIRVDRLGVGRAPGHHLLYLPRGHYLRAVSFGYNHVLADLIYLWSIQYYSNYQIQDRYQYLDQVYRRVIAELDPQYVDPYLLGSLIMSVEAGQDDLALKLLEVGMSNNPHEWILPFEAGFLCYHRLKDYARAHHYFEKAIQIEGVHPVAKRLYAEMFNRLGDKRTALEHWSQIYETADTEYVRHVGWMHVHDLSIDVDLEDLTDALSVYRERKGRLPLGLAALVRDGILDSLPTDPEGRGYLYDPRTGQVRSHSRRLLETH